MQWTSDSYLPMQRLVLSSTKSVLPPRHVQLVPTKVVGLPTALEWCYTAELQNRILLCKQALRNLLTSRMSFYQPPMRSLKIVKHSPVAIALTRQMMYRNSAQDHPRDAHNVDSLSIFYSSLGSGKEGVASFLEKREAVFNESAREMPPFYPWWES